MAKKILILFFLVAVQTYAQRCKVEKDPFSNETITFFDYKAKTVYFKVKNDSITFNVKFNYWGEREYVFDKGTEIRIKFDNGADIALKMVKKAKPIIELVTSSNATIIGFYGGFNVVSSENFTAYTFTFLLNKDELKKLSESKIDVIRIPDTEEGEYVDLKAKGLTKKKMKAIKKGATCIREQYNGA
ncbi:MAG: hypothetical protein CR968_04380 [Flavobacteriia bacterium]|nr:MAG: hypothetical protein CR968_04380 [Flavobacteriia bacterium]